MNARGATHVSFWVALYTAVLAGLTGSCGGGRPADKSKVIVETGPGENAAGSLEARVRADSKRAAELLVETIHSGQGSAAMWAAVYVRRLGIHHSPEKTRIALAAGAFDSDPLLAALCWRWLASDPEASLPTWPRGERPADAAVGAMAALAHARAGKLPKPLRDALGLPSGEPSGKRRDASNRVERLTYLAAPYDNGPLALAVAFAEARREKWVEDNGDRECWVAERLRQELYMAVVDETGLPSSLAESRSPEDPRYSILEERLDTPLASRPPEVLRGAVLAAQGSLRLDALRALAVVASQPAAGDLGAVAAAMRSTDPLVRVEAARTYLLLAALATDAE